MIDAQEEKLSIREQCMLLGLCRSSYYCEPTRESEENRAMMRRIDELHTAEPTWGSRLLRDRLRLEGWQVNRKRLQRLMRLMRLDVIYPKRKHQRLPPDHEVYPYLLRGITPDRPNHTWAIDITYIRLHDGFIYLVAVIDWYSRRILSWKLSLTLDKHFCVEALDLAMRRYGAPVIFNCDQGVQFTSPAFLQPLKDAGVKISMDGRGRATDNIIIERFWRTLKYDEVYLKDYDSPADAQTGIGEFIRRYNDERPHSSLGGVTPSVAYGSIPTQAVA